jgi:hypothetical protein
MHMSIIKARQQRTPGKINALHAWLVKLALRADCQNASVVANEHCFRLRIGWVYGVNDAIVKELHRCAPLRR